MTYLGSNIPRFPPPDEPVYSGPIRDQIEFDYQMQQIEALKEVRHRVNQAISAARARLEDSEEIISLLEAALHDASIEHLIREKDDECLAWASRGN